MQSYQTLAVLALAVSTASPTLSAPVLEQARAEVIPDEPGIAASLGSLLKTIGTGVGVGAFPVALEDLLGGNSTRRDTPVDFNGRRSVVGDLFDEAVNIFKSGGGLGSVLSDGLLGGVASGAGAIGASKLLNTTSTRRAFSLANITGIADDLLGALKSGSIVGDLGGIAGDFGGLLALRDDASPRDLIDALRLLSRQIDELD